MVAEAVFLTVRANLLFVLVLGDHKDRPYFGRDKQPEIVGANGLNCMIWFFTWLMAVEFIGLSALPAAVRLFRPLQDRGFLFAKPLGLLLVAYLAWLLGTFGIIRFYQSSITVIVIALGLGCWLVWGRETVQALSRLRKVVVASELLFLLGFALAAWIRAHNPEISGTEKPMDFAILNALYRTSSFPAEDPWMSGFSISYYYFGYLLIATLAKLSGVPAAVGYNLGVAVVFAMTLAGSFSLAFNLLSRLLPQWRVSSRLLGSLVAPLMVGVMGNLEGGLEILAARGIGDASFWKWIGVKGLEAAAQPTGWLPTAFWWWWRASRVIPTIKPDGIDEFPYFSFLLGDLHPHYTALPWTLLAVAVSLSALLGRKSVVGGDVEKLGVDWLQMVIPALALGFLLAGNSWDFPTYTFLFWACSMIPLSKLDWSRELLVRRFTTLFFISSLSVLLYGPFFLGFSSQTKGIALSTDKTPLPSMLILFGPFLFVAAAFLLWRLMAARGIGRIEWWDGSLAVVGVLLVLSSPLLGATSLIGGLLLLALGAIGRLLNFRLFAHKGDDVAAELFILVLVGLGLLLILGPEFVFLVDLFGTRMNTVFKFHYQAWLLLALGSSVAVVWMASALRPRGVNWLVTLVATLLVAVGLVYPLAATPAKIQESHSPATLDGAAFYRDIRPDDYAAIQWLSRTAVGRPVVLEATGGEYSEYARVSTFSGLPSVLGWAGHEVQWRGQGEEPQRRTRDIDAIYSKADRTTMLALLKQYHVRYVYVGTLEAEKYGQGVYNRFEGALDPVYRQGKVVIYRVPDTVVASGSAAGGG